MKDQAGIEVFSTTSEVDPRGLQPGDKGAKLDHGKTRMSLLKDFSRALTEVARVSTVGAEKYTEKGWVDVSDGVARYTDAAWRHLFQLSEVDTGPGGTGCLHEAQVIWNLLAALELKLRGGSPE